MFKRLLRDLNNYRYIVRNYGILQIPKKLMDYTFHDSGLLDTLDDYNHEDIVIPFLDSLNVEYHILAENMVIVKYSISLNTKLNSLGFDCIGSISSEFKNVHMFNRYLIRTQWLLSNIKLSQKYGILLHLVAENDWDQLTAATCIVDSLDIPNKGYLKALSKVHCTLVNLNLQ